MKREIAELIERLKSFCAAEYEYSEKGWGEIDSVVGDAYTALKEAYKPVDDAEVQMHLKILSGAYTADTGEPIPVVCFQTSDLIKKLARSAKVQRLNYLEEEKDNQKLRDEIERLSYLLTESAYGQPEGNNET